MMRALSLSLFIALGAWLLGLFLPWWSVVISALFFGALMGQKGTNAFTGGFAGIGMLWLVQSFFIHIGNEGVLTGRIAEMLDLPHSSLIFLITFLIGGITGGFASLTGYLCRKSLGK